MLLFFHMIFVFELFVCLSFLRRIRVSAFAPSVEAWTTSYNRRVILSGPVQNKRLCHSPTFHRDVKLSSSPFNNNQGDESYEYNSSNNDKSSSSRQVHAMRRALEESWNAATMGPVPTTPKSAASTAADSIVSALRDRREKNMMYTRRIFLLDLALPSFDVTSGPNVYDDVAAVEFCTELAKCLKTSGTLFWGDDNNGNGLMDTEGNERNSRIAILVKDEVIVRNVGRVLDAREGKKSDLEDTNKRQSENSSIHLLRQEEDETILSKSETTDASDITHRTQVVDYYDDFAEFTGDGSGTIMNSLSSSELSPESTLSINDFRQQLDTTWLGSSESTKRVASSSQRSDMNQSSLAVSQPRAYRLGSMLGDAQISSGPDMMNDVVKAVGMFAMPKEYSNDEDAIIILSPVSQSEMIAVRSLVGKYGNSKTIIIVNCRLDPLPRELLMAETVYSILPLLARRTVMEGNMFGVSNEKTNQAPSPKVVLLRRYPRDWELYVDIHDGNGFELVGEAPAKMVSMTGPSMEWIAGSVKKHIQFKNYGT